MQKGYLELERMRREFDMLCELFIIFLDIRI